MIACTAESNFGIDIPNVISTKRNLHYEGFLFTTLDGKL